MSQTENTGKRSILESVVIVISILLAFAIEALWNEQLENFTESKELERLHTEFIANRDRIQRSVGSQETVRAATEEFYDLIKDVPDASIAQPSPNRLIQAMLFAPTFDVTTPVLDSLLLSGNLSVIEDEAVLRSISGWQRSVAQVTEAEVSARDFTDTELFPSLIKRGNIGPLLILNNDEQRPAEGAGPGGIGGAGEGAGMGGIIAGEGLGMGGIDGAGEAAGMGGMTGENASGPGENNPAGAPPTRNRFTDERVTLITVDNELKGIIAQRIREAGRSSTTLDELERSADRLIDAIENAQD